MGKRCCCNSGVIATMGTHFGVSDVLSFEDWLQEPVPFNMQGLEIEIVGTTGFPVHRGPCPVLYYMVRDIVYMFQYIYIYILSLSLLI